MTRCRTEVRMFALEVLVGVVVLVGVALVAGGRFDSMSEENVDRRDVGLPEDRPIRSDDIPRLRFGVALRGYRMSDVDNAMTRLYDALRAAEAAAPEPTANERPEAEGPAAAGPSTATPTSPTPGPSPVSPASWSAPQASEPPTHPVPSPTPTPVRPEPSPSPVPPVEPAPPPPPAPPPMEPTPPPQPEPPVGQTHSRDNDASDDEPPAGEAAEQPPTDAESTPLSTLERLQADSPER